jgi:hypothetical protein
MQKIKTNAPVKNLMTGENYKDGGTGAQSDLTVRKLISDSVNVPPQILPTDPQANPKHKAELRAGIVEKLFAGDECEFRPDELDEIHFCVSAIQPPMIYLSLKKFLNGDNRPTDAETSEKGN